jgi:hypothetical protein
MGPNANAHRWVVAAVLLTASVCPAAASPISRERVYAIVVGVNTSMDDGVAALRYADDDAAKYARLFQSFADRIFLLTVFDADSRSTYADLSPMARVPDRAGLTRVIDEVGALAARDRAAGFSPVVYFVYTGHGARAKDGEGYVNLTDARLTRSDLRKLLLERESSATWARPDFLHVFIDACSAYYLVRDRGADLVAMPEGYEEHLATSFAPRGSDRFPWVGYVLATTGDAKVHEWEAYRGGVFSHLIRSGLTGAADIDLDGKVTYAELGAFVAAASGEIRDPRARINVTVIPPPANALAPLSERERFRPRQFVLFDERAEGRYVVEAADGERIVDMNKPRGQPAVVTLWGGATYFLEGPRGESVLDFRNRSVILASALSYRAARKSERGAVDEEYRRALFSRPFDSEFYRAYCTLMRMPPAYEGARAGLPRDLVAEAQVPSAGVTAPAEVTRPVESSGSVGIRTPVTLGAAATLGVVSGALFFLSSNAGDRNSQQILGAFGAGTAIAAGVAAVTGLSFLVLDLSGVKATASVTPAGATAGITGTF